jgi:hypothetical protein
MTIIPQMFHPNFTATGEWPDDSTHTNETMEAYLIRLVKVLQLKEINTDKIADRNAMAWYNKNRDVEL